MKTKETKHQIRGEIYLHIRGYNRHLTLDHLAKLNLVDLLRNTHPLDRVTYARRLRKEGFISEEQLTLFTSTN